MDAEAAALWQRMEVYFDLMAGLTFLQTGGNLAAVAVNAFFAGLVLMENDPEFAKRLRRTLEAAAAEETGQTAEQLEVAIREAFRG